MVLRVISPSHNNFKYLLGYPNVWLYLKISDFYKILGGIMVQMDEKDVAISYETLFEILRREKNREELQKLDTGFFSSTFDYMNGLHALLREKQGQGASDEEIEKLQLQMQNVKKIIRDLYNRREKKIVGIAVIKSRAQNSVINTDPLLETEKQLFDSLTEILEEHKTQQLGALAGNNRVLPDASSEPAASPVSEPSPGPTPEHTSEPTREENNSPEVLKPALKPVSDQSNELPLNMSDEVGSMKPVEEAKDAEDAEDAQQEQEALFVRFLEEVQKFVGPSLEIYGPFQEGDTAELPVVIANLLIEKQKAERAQQAQEDMKTVEM